MRIRVFHETNYTYEQPARGLIQVLRMRPRDHDGQYVRRWRIEPSVDGRMSEREDGFGNVVHWFTADEPAEALSIRVTGEVDTIEMHGIVRGTVERVPDVFYLRDSDLALANDGIRLSPARSRRPGIRLPCPSCTVCSPPSTTASPSCRGRPAPAPTRPRPSRRRRVCARI